MKIAIIGTGYVGLSVGVCFANAGHKVYCYDCNKEKIQNLNLGKIPIYEPKMEDLIKINTKNNNLIFTNDPKIAIENSQVCFVAVGTPSKENGKADTTQVENALKLIAKNIKNYTVIVNKSTLPIGYSDIAKEIIQSITKTEFDVISNPEFLKQGSAIADFINPERVVIGSNSQKAIEIILQLYSSLNIDEKKIIITNEKSAELIKYASNSFLALKISYINEIANLCEKIGADVEEVKKGLKSDSRIGSKFLEAGIGYGGSCFPKDVDAILNIAKENKVNLEIIGKIKKVNENQKELFCNKILKYFDNQINGKTFAIWGLTFKPNTNDLREAPSITIINKLLKSGAKIKAYDPKGLNNAKLVFGDNITYCNSKYDAIDSSDALILLTEWEEFKNPDFNLLSKSLKTKVIFDGRNQYTAKETKKYCIDYICVGRNE